MLTKAQEPFAARCLRTALGLIAGLALSGCIDAIKDRLDGAEGDQCVPSSSRVGDKIVLSDGRIATIQTISASSLRCPEHMRRSVVTADSPWAPETNYQRGLLYLHGTGGVNKDDAAAARWFRLSADEGNADAQVNLGYLYATGQGVPQDDQEAVRWYRKSAGQRNALGLNNLGTMYESGRGVAKDQTEALKLYRSAADLGNDLARGNLERMGAR